MVSKMVEITLIRHGRSEFELKGKARSCDIEEIIRSYDLAGISDEPPMVAKKKALTCHSVVCSDLNRSIESAKALGFINIHVTDPLFREVATPHFKSGSYVMPVSAWGVLLRSLSVFGFSRNGESLSMAKQRAAAATLQLIEIAHTYNSILLVGHAFINHFIAKELLSRNWIGPSKPGRGYWEYGVYKYHAT